MTKLDKFFDKVVMSCEIVELGGHKYIIMNKAVFDNFYGNIKREK